MRGGREKAAFDAVKVDQIWQLLHKRHQASALGLNGDECLTQQELRVARQTESLVNSEVGLGVQLRWSIAAEVLRQGRRGSSSTEVTKSELRQKLNLPRDFFQLGNVEAPAKSRTARMQSLHAQAMSTDRIAELCEELSTVYGSTYRDGLGRDRLTPDDFLCPAHGPLAARRFEQYLKTGRRPIAGNGSLVPERDYFPSRKRTGALRHVLQQLAKPNEGRPIQGIYMPGSPTGLCAIAHHLRRRIEWCNDLRPVLLLPCSRQVDSQQYLGLDFLVHHLLAMFEQRDVRPNPPHFSPDELTARIESLRQHLARSPAIIVLVGHEVVRGPQSHLRRAIRDDPVLDLLAHLVHPYVGDVDRPVDVANFQRSHIILLGDGPVEVLRPYCRPDIPFPQRTREQDSALLTSLGFSPEQRLEVTDGLRRMVVEPSEAVVTTFVQLRETERSLGLDSPSRLDRLTGHGSSGVPDQLVATLRQHGSPLDLLLFRIIALCGSGIRRATLWRCALIWSRTVAAHDVAQSTHLRVNVPDARTRDTIIDELRKRYSLILLEGADEPRPELQYGHHPYEYPDYPEPTTGVVGGLRNVDLREGRSLDIRYAEVRAAFLRDLHQESLLWPKYLLHHIICAEALRQQTLLLRHTQASNRASWRAYRRALESLYHGLCSLPPASQLNEAVNWPSPSGCGALPSEAIDRFRFLVGVVYQRVLDGTRMRRVTRQWAADDVKLDVCELIQSAFGSEPSIEPLSFSVQPAWAIEPQLSPLKEFLEDHYTASAVAAFRANDTNRWRDIAQGIATFLAPDRPMPPDGFSTLEKTQFDMAIVQYGPLSAQTSRVCEESIERLSGISIASLEAGPWDGRGAGIHVPRVSDLDAFIREFEVRLCDLPQKDEQPLADWLIRLADIKYQTIDFDRVNIGLRWALSLQAFVMLKLADSLGNRAFRRNATSADPHLPPNAVRTFARAGMEALRLLQEQRDRVAYAQVRDRMLELSAKLAAEVRMALDWYALEGSFYAPDAVALLVLESRFARTAGSLTEGTEVLRHEVALRFLLSAERRLIEFRSRPRLRLRLLVERCAVLRGLAKHLSRGTRTPSEEALRFLALAKMDVVQLDNIIEDLFGVDLVRGLNFGAAWRRAASHQREATESAASAIRRPT